MGSISQRQIYGWQRVPVPNRTEQPNSAQWAAAEVP